MHRVAWLIVAGMLAGCASRKTKDNSWPAGRPVPGGAIVTPASGTFGRVVSVNPGGRFVVLSYPVGTLPALEKRLGAFRSGLKVAELRVTGPTRDTHIVADVLSGDCRIGDEVRED